MTLSAATPTVQTLLAFDFGQKRIGVAVGNSLTGAARPLATAHARLSAWVETQT